MDSMRCGYEERTQSDVGHLATPSWHGHTLMVGGVSFTLTHTHTHTHTYIHTHTYTHSLTHTHTHTHTHTYTHIHTTHSLTHTHTHTHTLKLLHLSAPSAPRDFRVVSSTPSSLSLAWALPDPLNGLLAAYQLLFGEEDTFDTQHQTRSVGPLDKHTYMYN